MKSIVYNEPNNPASLTYMEDGDVPAMQNEAVTFHEAMRAP